MICYEADNILAMRAIPTLVLHNTLALQILMQAATAAVKDNKPLGNNAESWNKFRHIMGFRNGFAGLGHLADLLLEAASSMLVQLFKYPPCWTSFCFSVVFCGPLPI